MEERAVATLPGYRGMGPVRVGNEAYRQVQNDVYGSAILAATHAFFDHRLLRPGNEGLFAQLEALGERAARAWSQPDAGLWELRGATRVHTSSERHVLGGLRPPGEDRRATSGSPSAPRYWRAHADAIHRGVCERAWNARRASFVATFDGDTLDASLLLLAELGFLRADDPRFATTVAAIERELKRGDFIMRYAEADDFGNPQQCIHRRAPTGTSMRSRDSAGARKRARCSSACSGCRTRHGLFSEHIDPETGELWGNFPQTYSLVGLINSATRLSIAWDDAF